MAAQRQCTIKSQNVKQTGVFFSKYFSFQMEFRMSFGYNFLLYEKDAIRDPFSGDDGGLVPGG